MSDAVTLHVAGREVRLSNPGKVFFPERGLTKLDLANYDVAVADAACVHMRERPGMPANAPAWLETATVTFPSGRSATELVANDGAHLVWARVSCPLRWDEVAAADPEDLRLDTVPHRLAGEGDPAAGIDAAARSLDALLELAARDERKGLGDAPWPPHVRKQAGEGRRVRPSRRRAP